MSARGAEAEPVYARSDREVLELLIENELAFPVETLLELARRRGILLSASSSRQALCAYLSRLGWNYADMQDLQSRALEVRK